MSDILICGMELPEDKEICLRIDKKGEVYVYGSYPTELYKAVPVPPHGKLIDADALFAEIEGMDIIGTMDNENDAAVSHDAVLCFIDNAPTIIPASKEGET